MLRLVYANIKHIWPEDVLSYTLWSQDMTLGVEKDIADKFKTEDRWRRCYF